MAPDDMLICVQSEWNGWKTARVRLSDLEDIHWFQPIRAPRPIAHGYICCSRIVAGEVPHDCHSVSAPHRLRVCVLKRHSPASAYEEIARRADQEKRSARPGLAVDVPPT
jgi:hypothetical protein